jgi:hypothetical protein
LDATLNEGFSKPTKGQFVSFSVTEKAITNGVDYNLFEYYVRGPDGAHYNPGTIGTKDPAFNSGTLHAGEPVKGYVSFDAPAHGTLVYSQPFSASVVEWKF